MEYLNGRRKKQVQGLLEGKVWNEKRLLFFFCGGIKWGLKSGQGRLDRRLRGQEKTWVGNGWRKR